MSRRFRGYLPVVVDVETGGFDWNKHALLEIACVPIEMDAQGHFFPGETASAHLVPAPGLEIDPKSLEITGIVLDHPFRFAKQEKDALDHVFAPVRAAVKKYGCQRAILVGHNAHFDLNFLNAAVARVGHKRNPFHPFSVFDTVTLAGVAYGQTVLARAAQAAGLTGTAPMRTARCMTPNRPRACSARLPTRGRARLARGEWAGIGQSGLGTRKSGAPGF